MLDFAAKHYGVSRDSCGLEHNAVRCNGTRVPLADFFHAARQADANWKVSARLTEPRAASRSRSRAFASPCTASRARSSSYKASTGRTAA